MERKRSDAGIEYRRRGTLRWKRDEGQNRVKENGYKKRKTDKCRIGYKRRITAKFAMCIRRKLI